MGWCLHCLLPPIFSSKTQGEVQMQVAVKLLFISLYYDSFIIYLVLVKLFCFYLLLPVWAECTDNMTELSACRESSIEEWDGS